ncbi:MAG: MBL fold metallo-hydrolase [Dehalococcoidia bacterium]|nr:MBL fold metallo-hydrolase [Dehalococcoidia bacterium]
MCLLIRFCRGKRKAERYWRESGVRKIANLGATKHLTILPLVDWYTSSEELKGEAGVSYLIKTDTNSILFDVGYNVEQSDPSPLLHNMKQLEVSMDDFDAIVISHNHCDHVGGTKWEKRKSFSLTTHQVNLEGKVVYTPIPMTYPGLNPICTETPTVIATGVATIGVIPNQDFFLGWILEQALAVNVGGKGIVLIMGCGHQTLSKIIKRAEALFEEPIYGVIGGLHYPVTDSREKMMGIKIQKYAGKCRLPWEPITMGNVKESIDRLKKLNPRVVGLSAHDSCDASIAVFRNAFPNAYRDIKVGEEISIES